VTSTLKKVLLCGIGRWGVNHLRVLHSLPVDLFVCDTDPRRLEPARTLGISESRLTTDLAKFAGLADAAVIVTPAGTHFPLGREMLALGKDVFIEKPLALTSEEAKHLAEMAQLKERILQIGHIFRFEPASRWLRDAVRAGRFGRIRMIRGHFGGFKRPRNDTGVLFADGIHFVDLFNYLLGSMPETVLAIHHDFMGRGIEDVSFVSLEYDTGRGTTWATVESDYHIPGKFRQVIITGEKLVAICDYTAARDKISLCESRHARNGAEIESIEGPVTKIECPGEEPLSAELRAFLESIHTRRKPLAGGWEGYEAVRVLEAAMASAKTGRKIKLD
jgi:UDP-2-acetamido-3-amino-2,3-dideoxy-glucuronate N-acetyltransferase